MPFNIKTLGDCRVPSPLPLNEAPDEGFNFVPDDSKILYHVDRNANDNSAAFEAAGPRAKIYFDPSKVRAGIVTCGGLCPGINNVIRALVMQMNYNYGVRNIYGFRYGFEGFIPKYRHDIMRLTPDVVRDIHYQGGSILSNSRGAQSDEEIVDCLERHNVNMLFCIGGDGTLKGTHRIAEKVLKRNLKIAVVGIPKTIDNDIPYCAKTFGFETAFTKAVDAVQSAHAEANGCNYGIVIIKLMGRDSGFIAANSSLACPDVNYVLIPEVPFVLEGRNGLLQSLEKSLRKSKDESKHPHAVIVVSEGAGQDLMGNDGTDRDPSGNIRYKDVGGFLKKKIGDYFKGKLPVSLKLIEPSYLIRSLPANPHDAIFCYYLADHAVHAAMSGKTDLMVGHWNGHFTHVALDIVGKHTKRIDPNSDFWRQVLFSTGQPKELFSLENH